MNIEKIRILSYNIQGKESKPSSDSKSKKKINKFSVLLRYMKENHYDLACLQETKAYQGQVEESVERFSKNDFFQVIECSNTDNSNKGGVAIININPNIDITKVVLDNELTQTWIDEVEDEQLHRIDQDNIKGKFMEVRFNYQDQIVNLVNVYGPTVPGHSNSYFCRRFFL